MSKWMRTIDFSNHEKDYLNGKISLQEMAKRIFDYLSRQTIYGYGAGFDEEFTEIVDGTLHTIAFQDEIFEEGEELPTEEDYESWKEELYDWADDIDVVEYEKMKEKLGKVPFSQIPKNAWVVPVGLGR